MDTIDPTQPCGAQCPVEKTANVLDGKWTTLVIRELLPGTKWFSEIQRGLDSISPKVLTARLRHLEEAGMLTRTVYPTVPPKTEYALTPLGQKLESILNAMAQFGAQLEDAE